MDSFDPESFGRGLLWLRHFQQLSQDDVAEKAGITRGQLSNYETGLRTPRLPMLRQILRALDADLSDLHDALSVVCDQNFCKPSARPLQLALARLCRASNREPTEWQSDS